MAFRQLDIYTDSKNICLPIALLRLSPDALAERFGISFVDECDDLDRYKGALIESDSGRRFGLVCYLHAPVHGVAVWANEHSKDLVAELADFKSALPIDPTDYLSVHPDAQA